MVWYAQHNNQLYSIDIGTGINGGITSRRYAEEMLTEVFIIYLMNAIQQLQQLQRI